MIISLIIFCLSLLGIFLFLTWKAPALADFSEKDIDDDKDFIVTAKEKLEESVRNEVREGFEEALGRILSSLRKVIVKVERVTTKWLYTLKRRKRERGNSKPE